MFYAVLVSFTLGVALRTLVEITIPSIAWVAMVGFVVATVARKNSETVYAQRLFVIALCLVSFALGLVRTELHFWNFGHSTLESQVGREITLDGVVAKEPEMSERSLKLYVASEQDIVLVSTDRLANINYGDHVSVVGTIKKPESFTTDLGRTFNYPNYLQAKGVEFQISFADVTVLSEGSGSKFMAALLSVKHRLMTGIEKVLPEPQSGLGEGLLLGVKQALGTQLESDFRTTGIIHIVVLSGYNVMLVVAFVMYVLGLFLGKSWRIFAGILAIISFALIVGLSATVVRASIMASLLLVADVYGRTYDVLRALFFAGFVMIFINPFLLLYDIGFQLSFMATLGLLLVAPHFEVLVSKVPTQIGIKDFLTATVATQIAVLPLLLYNIGQVSVVAVVVNVLVLPVVPIAMLLTFVTGVLALISTTIALPVAYLANAALSYIIFIAEQFALLPFAAVTVPAFSPWGVVILYGVPAALYFWHQYRKNSSTQFSDWVIEEESAAPKGAAPISEVPVFFR